MNAAAPAEDGASARSLGVFGMRLFLASLGMLFAGSLAAFLIIRVQADAWPPPGAPGIPVGLFVSTPLLLLSSGSMWWGLRNIRAGNGGALSLGLLATLVLGLAFLGVQGWAWSALYAAELTARSNLYGFTFFMLTGLHAAHVIGGLIPLGIVTTRAFLNRYSAEDHRGVELVSMYWHFLDAVWIVLFAVLFVAA